MSGDPKTPSYDKTSYDFNVTTKRTKIAKLNDGTPDLVVLIVPCYALCKQNGNLGDFNRTRFTDNIVRLKANKILIFFYSYKDDFVINVKFVMSSVYLWNVRRGNLFRTNTKNQWPLKKVWEPRPPVYGVETRGRNRRSKTSHGLLSTYTPADRSLTNGNRRPYPKTNGFCAPL